MSHIGIVVTLHVLWTSTIRVCDSYSLDGGISELS